MMVYDNVVNQPNQKNKYKNTTKSITELDKQSKGQSTATKTQY